jgi:sulfur carrier protein ThiS
LIIHFVGEPLQVTGGVSMGELLRDLEYQSGALNINFVGELLQVTVGVSTGELLRDLEYQ